MWELIRQNKRKSLILFMFLGVCLLLLGYFVGAAFYPGNGGVFGLAIALGIWFFMSVISYFSGDSIILAVSGARQVNHDVHPQLFNVVEEMKIAANLPAMPKVYIIPSQAANAFATGRDPKKSSIAVTAGLLSRLNRDQLQGVIAHEMSHIVNRDVLFMTFSGVLLGSIVLISEVFLRGIWFSGGTSRRYRSGKSKGSGEAQLIIMVVAIVLAILAPLLARMLYLAISRRREYLADASAARLTRYPEGLASALEEISSGNVVLSSMNKVTAPMYIVNPLKSAGSTHPPIGERIKILRGMSHGVNYKDYQKAYSLIKGGKSAAIIPPSGLVKGDVIPIRKPSAEKRPRQSKKKGIRNVGDLMRAVNKYVFLVCVCRLKIKLPSDFKKSKVNCPRCKRHIKIPAAELAAVAAVAGSSGAGEDKRVDEKKEPRISTYKRKSTGWETFSCACGNLLQISPAFAASYKVCKSCGRKTIVKS